MDWIWQYSPGSPDRRAIPLGTAGWISKGLSGCTVVFCSTDRARATSALRQALRFFASGSSQIGVKGRLCYRAVDGPFFLAYALNRF